MSFECRARALSAKLPSESLDLPSCKVVVGVVIGEEKPLKRVTAMAVTESEALHDVTSIVDQDESM